MQQQCAMACTAGVNPGNHLVRWLLSVFCTLPLSGLAQGAAAQSGAATESIAAGMVAEAGASADAEAATGAEERFQSRNTDLELSRDFGDITIYPIFNIGLGFHSDVYNNQGESGSSGFVSLRAGGGVQGENRGHLYGAEYMVDGMRHFEDSVDDDEIIQRSVAYWGTAFDARHNLDLGVEYLDSFDPRGQDDPRRDIRNTTGGSDPDTWTELTYGATYTYGVPGARGRIEAGPCFTCKEYDNNDQQYRNREILDLGATLYVEMTGRTDGFVQVIYSDFDYTDQSPDDPAEGRSLDSEEWRYMVGATWMASAKTTGILRVGIVDKEFHDPIRGTGDYREMTWDAIVHWTPGSRDRFTLSYFRSPREPLVWNDDDELVDDFIELEELGLDWSRQLGRNMSFNLGGYIGHDEWEPSGRQDDLWGVTSGLRYAFPSWGSIGISYFYRERDSSESENDYRDDGILIDFNIGRIFGFGLGDSRAPLICLLRSFSSGSGYNSRAGY